MTVRELSGATAWGLVVEAPHPVNRALLRSLRTEVSFGLLHFSDSDAVCMIAVAWCLVWIMLLQNIRPYCIHPVHEDAIETETEGIEWVDTSKIIFDKPLG